MLHWSQSMISLIILFVLTCVIVSTLLVYSLLVNSSRRDGLTHERVWQQQEKLVKLQLITEVESTSPSALTYSQSNNYQ